MAERTPKPRNPAKTVPLPKSLRDDIAAREAEAKAARAAFEEAKRALEEARDRLLGARAAESAFLRKGDEGLPIIRPQGGELVVISRTAEVLVTRPAGAAAPVRRWKWHTWSKTFLGKRPGRWLPVPEIPVSVVDAVFPLTEVSDG